MARVYTSAHAGGKREDTRAARRVEGRQAKESIMATQPPPESPVPSSQPVQPDSPPPEVAPAGPDIDQPSPGTSPSDPGTSQPAEM